MITTASSQPAHLGIWEFSKASTTPSVIRTSPCAPGPLLTMYSATPWKARKNASVTTKDGIRTFATSSPIRRPMTMPVTSAAPMLIDHGMS